jgi:FkbM family methyltransferase
MWRVKPVLYKTLMPLRRRLGYDLINRNKFGYDPFLDIQRLSGGWEISIARFFDVGANDGGTARLAASYFPQARIIAFEPHPATFARLVKRMARQPRFEAYNLALGPQTGEVTLFEYRPSRINSLAPNAPYAVRFPEKATTIPVQCTTVDAFCALHEIDAVDVLKIDTEGFDMQVLQGAATLIDAGALRFIYIEFNDVLPREGVFGGALAPIAELIAPHGYRFVATYNDYIVAEGEMFGVSNALFALPPHRAFARKPASDGQTASAA